MKKPLISATAIAIALALSACSDDKQAQVPATPLQEQAESAPAEVATQENVLLQ